MSELLQARQIQNVNATRNYIRQTLIDQNMQTWQANLEISTKGLNYKLYKSDINIENDLTLFPQKVYYPIIRFRITNHKLPVELGRWENMPFDERKCNSCITCLNATISLEKDTCFLKTFLQTPKHYQIQTIND